MVSGFRKGIKEALENFVEVSIISISEKILEQIITLLHYYSIIYAHRE